MEFCHLHLHTTYSLGDGLSQPEQYLELAAKKNISAVAITEHGNMYSFPQFYLASKRFPQIKSIYGQEFYMVESLLGWQQLCQDESIPDKNTVLKNRQHIVLLAQNDIGLQNIFQLTYKANLNMYYVPRIDLELLSEHSDGVICLTACIGGYIPNLILTQSDKEVRDGIEVLQLIFEDRLYFELQPFNDSRQQVVNKALIKYGEEFNVPIVITNDVHYPQQELWESRELVKQIIFKKTVDQIDMIHAEDGFCLKSGEEMVSAFKKYHNYIPEGLILEYIANTNTLALKTIEEIKYNTDVKLLPLNETIEDDFVEMSCLCYETLQKKQLNSTQYIERLEHELDIIGKKQFSSYMLTVRQIVQLAKTNGIMVGCARGSAAGSLVCYLLGITQIDPIKHNLMFERFINIDREEYPDIDVDFSDNVLMKEIIEKKYGRENVASISNYNSPAIGLIKDLARIYSISFADTNIVTKAINDDVVNWIKAQSGEHFGVVDVGFEDVEKYIAEKPDSVVGKFFAEHKELLPAAHMLKGYVRQVSRHAGGIVFYKNLSSVSPVFVQKNVQQTVFSKDNAEKFGFVKMDILGLKTLRIFQSAIKKIICSSEDECNNQDVEAWYNQNLHPDVLDFNDEEVLENVFKMGFFEGIFQFESRGMRQLVKASNVESFEDVVALNAIYRPGALSSGVDKEWIKVRARQNAPHYIHPLVEQVLSPTYGFIIFQEQVLRLANLVGKMEMVDTDKLRRALVKRKDLDELELLKEKFFSGAKENGLSDKQTESLWTKIDNSSKYLFNRAHALSYTVIAYQCAHLRSYYPIEWLLANLEENFDNKLLFEIQNAGYKIVPPKISNLTNKWVYDSVNEAFVMPMSVAKYVGNGFELAIQKLKSFISKHQAASEILMELLPYTNVRVLQVLIKVGVFDELNDLKTRKNLVEFLTQTNKKSKKKIALENKNNSLFDVVSVGAEQDIIEYTDYEILEFEKDLLGHAFTAYGKAIEKFSPVFKNFDVQMLHSFSLSELDGRAWYWGIIMQHDVRKTKKGKSYMTFGVLMGSEIKTVKVWDMAKIHNSDLLRNNKGELVCAIFKELANDGVYGLSCKEIILF